MKKYQKIGLFVGHSKLKSGAYTSANKIVNEYEFNKQLGRDLKAQFEAIGQPCDLIICPEGTFTSSKQEDDYKLPIANSGKYDLIVELHLNAFDGTAKGSEVLYCSNSGKVVAQRVQDKLKTQFNNRGIKFRDGLYMLKKTKPVAIMIETLFCDNQEDVDKANKIGTKGIAKLIAEGVCDTTINNPSTASTNTNIQYRVMAGAFVDKKNAEERVKLLKSYGIDAFIESK